LISDAEVNHSNSKDPTYNPVGEKGGSISDAEVNDSDSKDPTYNPPADFDDDDLFYSEDEDLDAALDRRLDEIARAIEYSDPKKSYHGRCRTTTIAGGLAPPDYTGMDEQEKENAKATYKVKRKAYADKIHHQQLKLNVDQNTGSLATYMGCLHPVLRPMSVVKAK
jgi:hypothetical protein